MAKKRYSCPTCSEEFQKETSSNFPFCSKRCQLIDLGEWASEKYSVPSLETPESDFELEELKGSTAQDKLVH
ncbi:MAG: DNA gyrase inhibitor YacG [Bdellovibrionales bacterium]|nr:DNA gyrase inhibitor YacG [Bdellovibrionales bacterium]